MALNVLVVSIEQELGLKFLNDLKLSDADVSFVSKLTAALPAVRRNEFDLILLGDKLESGDIKDVALDIRGTKNKKTPVVCIGYNRGRANRLASIVGQHCLLSVAAEDEGVIKLLASYFGLPEVEDSRTT